MNQQPETVPAVLLSGNTYTVRRECAAAGGRWSHERGGYLWSVDQRETAERLADIHDLVCTDAAVLPAELEPPTLADKRAARAARHERRGMRMAGWADSHEAAADQHRTRADGPGGMMKDWAAITQPITSNSGGRAWARTKERMRDSLEREHNELQIAAAQRTAADAATADAERIAAEERDPGFCQRRIEEIEAGLRRIDRWLAGEGTEGQPPAGARRDQLLTLRVERAADLAFWQGKMAEAGGVAFGPHNVKTGDVIRIRWGWSRVDRVNRKTASYTILTGGAAAMKGKVPWAEVRGVRTEGGAD